MDVLNKNDNSISLNSLKTFDELLNSAVGRMLSKFISRRQFKKFNKQNLIPCYLINGKKGYKAKEVEDWAKNQLIKKWNGAKIITNFHANNVNLEKAVDIPPEISQHSGDLYEFNLYTPPSIYFLILRGEVVYVGQSTNLSSRIEHHKTNKEFDKVLHMHIDQERLLEIERFFIEILEPKYNKEGFVQNKSYRFKNLGYRFLNKILYKEDSNGLLKKHI